MFKFFVCFACVSVALAAPSLVTEHHTLLQEPVLAKVGSVVHTAPSAVSHQSFTRVHNKAVVTPVVAPVVKTTVHTAEPLVKTVQAVPAVKTIETPVVSTYHASAVLPVVKTIHTPVVAHAVSHQSHVQLHANVAPVVKTVVAPAVYAAAPITHIFHH